MNGCMLIFKYVCLLAWRANPSCRHLLRDICVSLIPTVLFSLYYKYTEQTLITVFRIDLIIWRDKMLDKVSTLSPDHLRIRAIIINDSFQTLQFIQFHCHGLPQTVVFSYTSQCCNRLPRTISSKIASLTNRPRWYSNSDLGMPTLWPLGHAPTV